MLCWVSDWPARAPGILDALPSSGRDFEARVLNRTLKHKPAGGLPNSIIQRLAPRSATCRPHACALARARHQAATVESSTWSLTARADVIGLYLALRARAAVFGGLDREDRMLPRSRGGDERSRLRLKRNGRLGLTLTPRVGCPTLWRTLSRTSLHG